MSVFHLVTTFSNRIFHHHHVFESKGNRAQSQSRLHSDSYPLEH
jgi:hypothetical protein